MSSQPSRPKPGFPPGRLSSDMWTGHLGNGNGRLSQAGGSWVPVQHLPWNNQGGHRYGKQGVRPAGLTCPVLLTPHCSEDKPQTAACEVLRAQWQAANPELPRVYPERISRNACRLVLPWTDWNKPQDSTLFLLFPRTLQLHIIPAQVKVNSTSCTEMRKKNPALP